jgi:DNA topoisomerase-1
MQARSLAVATESSSLAKAKVLRLRAEARLAARAAGLRYVDDAVPGLRRLRKGTGFSYLDARGRPVRDQATLARIKKLAIPPAWTEVWISPVANGHIQATGRDARGRKQYRYHASWSLTRDADKHKRICDFARLLPKLRAHCRRQLRQPGLSREVVLAALLRLVDLTSIRVGNEEYTRANSSFGLTTLRTRHARVRGDVVEFRYRGKSGIQRHVTFRDKRLAEIVQACAKLRGRQLFHYLDEHGVARPVRSEHVNAYLRKLTAPKFSVKDFRTWSATVRVAVALRTCGPAETQRAAKKALLEAIRNTAEYLGNTPAVCRKSYVHPGLLDAYMDGHILPDPPRSGPISASELLVLQFLERLHASRGARVKLARAG